MKSKIAVIYKSKYGSTKRYAGWIALKLDADLYEINDISTKELDNYDTIIYGGGIYIGKINGLNFISKNIEKLKEKELIVFAVGMESGEDKLQNILSKNLDEDTIKRVKVFKFRGAFDYSQLNIIDKLLMKGLKSTIDKKGVRDLTEDDKIVLQGFEEEVNLCNKKSIEVLLENLGKEKNVKNLHV